MKVMAEGQYDGEMELRGTGLTPPDQWMIHFTSNAADIERSGFLYGTPDIDGLALTYGSVSSVPGYNFAMLADDEYALRTISEYTFGLDAREAVIFQSEAVEVSHYDDFAQGIFWGPSAAGPFIRIKCPLDPDDPEDADRLMEIDEPHDYPFDVLDERGDVVSSHPNLFSAIDAAIERGLELSRTAAGMAA
jgi:hypothetical protein